MKIGRNAACAARHVHDYGKITPQRLLSPHCTTNKKISIT